MLQRLCGDGGEGGGLLLKVSMVCQEVSQEGCGAMPN